MNEQKKVYTCTRCGSTRVRKPSWKKTVSITLPQKLIEKAKNQRLNISKVTEQALSSIIDYLQVQNTKTVLDETSSQEVSVVEYRELLAARLNQKLKRLVELKKASFEGGEKVE